MPDKPTIIEAQVEEFLALKTHEEQCVYYHAHPDLHTIFRSVLFPKPESKVAAKVAAHKP